MPPASLPVFISRLKPLWVSSLAALVFTTSACNKRTEAASLSGSNTPRGTTVAGLHQNNLGNAGGSLLASLSSSPVHWQKWGSHIFKHAEQEQRTIFALIGSGTDPDTLEILEQINNSPSTCTLLNQQHVNVLIDSDSNPAMDYFAASLCMRSGTHISRPLLIWFSYEGNPISWSPSGSPGTNSSQELISRMSNTVHRLWMDDPKYVLENSRSDFARRIKPILPSSDEKTNPAAPARAIRQLASLFDPTSNNIDRIGKISAARYINLLARASASDAVLEGHRLRYGGIARLSAQNTLIYGLIDPIDGGVFDGVQRVSTALPVFSKNLVTQAISMSALYNLYQFTNDQIYLTAADKIKKFTEKNLKLSNGDYMLGIVHAYGKTTNNHCIWTLEELEKAFTEEELRVSKFAFDIRGLGNVPLVDDRNRAYFRKNIITWKTTKLELAKKTQFSHSHLDKLLESIKKKLSKLRADRGPNAFEQRLSSAKALALYTSSLVNAYRATGNDTHLQDARNVFDHINTGFRDEAGKLHEARFNGKMLATAASASSYSLVCAAALDLHEVTLENSYLKTAASLHTQMTNALADKESHYLYEQDFSSYPANYHVMQMITIPSINNFSSWALAWSNTSRLLRYKQDEHLKKQKQALENRFVTLPSNSAIVNVDYLTNLSTLTSHQVYFNAKATDDLFATAVRRPCQIIAMSGNSHPDLEKEVPPGSAAVTYDGKLIGITNQASELKQWLK